MAASEFQRGNNCRFASARSVAGVFAGVLFAASSTAYAQQTSATAAFPLVVAYGPAVAPGAPAAAYPPASTYTAAAAAPAATTSAPSAPVPVHPYEPYENPAAGRRAAPPVGSNPAVDRRDRAQKERERAESWMLAIEGYTTAPVDIGGRVTFETPFRLRLSGAYGIVPGAYFGLVNDVVEASGAYDSFGADLAEASLDDGHVWRAMVGLRPIGGLYLDAGYARIALSGGLQADQFHYSIDTTLHMWTAEIGYQGTIGDHLVVAFGVGLMRTISADSAAVADFELGNRALAQSFTDDAVDEYERKLEEYGFVPTVTLRLGWDFF